MAPFVVVYGVLFVYPTIKMVELAFTNAPLIGRAPGSASTISGASLPTVSSRSPSGIRFILSSCPSSRACCSASRRARRQPAEGMGAERRAGGVLPALYPAGFRRLPDLEWMFDKDFGVAQYVFALFNKRPARFGVPTTRFSCRRSRFLTVWWLLGFNVLPFIAACATFRRESTRRRNSTAPAAGRSSANHLAADLAGHRACLHHSADPAV